MKNCKVGDNANVHLRMAIKRALASGMLVANATHAGTFRLAPEAKKAPKTPKKKTVTAKKPATHTRERARHAIWIGPTTNKIKARWSNF